MTNQPSKRKSFIIHKDSLSVLKKLNDVQAGKLFKSIAAYQEHNLLPEDNLISIIFEPFLNQFIRDEENYRNTCERRREAGSKGGKQKVANASKSKQKLANLADSKSKSDSDSDSKNKSDSKKESKKKSFTKPTLQDIQDYCKERNSNVDADKFFNYYEANGWKVGKNSMKDWRAAVRTWENNNKEKTNQFNIDKWNKY